MYFLCIGNWDQNMKCAALCVFSYSKGFHESHQQISDGFPKMC